MASSDAPARRYVSVAIAAAAALVIARSLIWVLFEHAHFDSDQAVHGLMARHLAAGRTLPLMYYGQPYLLAVEAWLAAPLFRLLGASVPVLKLPVLAINVAIVVLLLWILVRRVGLTPRDALASCLWFALPPPVISSQMSAAAGGTIEPFLYILLLWIARRRPVVFGALGGFAFLNREFAVYGIVAIVALDAWMGRLASRRRLGQYALSLAAFLAVLWIARVLLPHVDLLGPGTAGTITGLRGGQTSFWASKLCWRPRDLDLNLTWLVANNLTVVFGWAVQPVREFARSEVVGGAWWAWIPFAVAVTAACAGIWRRRDRETRDEAATFPVYLVLVGMQAALAYAVLGCLVRDRTLIRYTLLALFVPIGLMALCFARQPPAWMRRTAIAGVLVWAGLTGFDNLRVAAEYFTRTPPNPYRQLAAFLEAQGVAYARAPYWTAYALDFLTGERLVVASFDKVRVQEYERVVEAHDGQSVQIFENDPCTDGERLLRWCFLHLDRAHGVARAPRGGG